MTVRTGNGSPGETATTPSRFWLLPVLVLCVVVDQVTKVWAVAALEDQPPVAILPTLEFDLHYNSGFSFGTGQGAGRWIALLVIALALYLVRLIITEKSTVRALLFTLILAGALGNLLDRVFRAEDGFLTGDVVDFIDVSWFAIFNVADILVVGGVIAFALFELVGPGRLRHDHDHEDDDDEDEDEESGGPSMADDPTSIDGGRTGSSGP